VGTRTGREMKWKKRITVLGLMLITIFKTANGKKRTTALALKVTTTLRGLVSTANFLTAVIRHGHQTRQRFLHLGRTDRCLIMRCAGVSTTTWEIAMASRVVTDLKI
jgi:hypothetical protein